MNCTLHLSPEAETCIDEQLQWFEADEQHGGFALADRRLSALEQSLASLLKNPTKCGFAPENGRWNPNLLLRQFRFKPWKADKAWRVLYILEESERKLVVIQIRHERRKWLFEEPTD